MGHYPINRRYRDVKARVLVMFVAAALTCTTSPGAGAPSTSTQGAGGGQYGAGLSASGSAGTRSAAQGTDATNSNGVRRSKLTSTLKAGLSGNSGAWQLAGWIGWLLVAVLLAFLFVLLGVAVGRRRQPERATA